MNVVLYIAAVVVFALALFGVTVAGRDELEVVSLGLALFAAAHVAPPRG